MRYPYPYFLDVTPVMVYITEMDWNGASKVCTTFSGKCNYSEKHRTVYGKDGKRITTKGKVIIGCDVAPGYEIVQGEVIVGSKKYKIHESCRPKNPDGSVHHTELELI
jgi:hypothetical protein